MPTYNLFEIMHNIWFQQLKKMRTCLYTATPNDYVQTFKQTTLYYYFKKRGSSCQGLNKNEFFLHKTTQFGDLKQLANNNFDTCIKLIFHNYNCTNGKGEYI